MKNDVTELGKKLRILRVELDMNQAQMADKLNVTATLLSRIEMGRQAPPVNFFNILKYSFPQIKNEEETYLTLVNLARGECKISLEGVSLEDATLATMFAKRFTTLSTYDKEQITLILNKKEEHV